MTDNTQPPTQQLLKPNKTTAKQPPTFLIGKVTPQHYDDLVERNFEKPSYLQDQEPGNGD